MNKLAIAICANTAGAGKDTLFGVLAAKAAVQGMCLTNIKFATELDVALRSHLPMRDAEYDHVRNHAVKKDIPYAALRASCVKPGKYKDWLVEKGLFKEYASVRDHLLAFGTDYIRGYKNMPNHWADLGIHAALSAGQKGSPVITDMRFPNELVKVDRFNFITIHVTGHGEPVKRVGDGLIDPDDCDYQVINVKGHHEAMWNQLVAQGFKF